MAESYYVADNMRAYLWASPSESGATKKLQLQLQLRALRSRYAQDERIQCAKHLLTKRTTVDCDDALKPAACIAFFYKT